MTVTFLLKLDPVLVDIARSIAAGLNEGNATIEGVLHQMTAQLAALKTEVERNTAVTNSAVALISGLAQQIRDLKDDPAALEALAASLDANSDSLAAAVEANTVTPPVE